MARGETIKPYVSFVRGLITEASELTFPENASSDELNCVLHKKGNRARRLGVNYEVGHTISAKNLTAAEVQDNAITTGVWKSVAGDGNLTFLVAQVGNILSFYDTANIPVSSGLKSFTVDISTYLAPAAVNPHLTQVDMDSGKGYLFVTSEKIKPIYITHDPALDTITVTEVSIQIRDFEGIDEVGVDVQTRPSTLTTSHKYNVFNQGWYIDDVRLNGGNTGTPLSKMFAQTAVYPANSDVWWLMKDTNLEFNARWREQINRGSAQAPQGHYILDPFFKDRSSVSGIVGISVTSIDSRPTSVAFYAGRSWFAGQKGADISDNIFYSQIIEDPTNIGKCYQHNDPTSEDLSGLLPTDGGVVVISDIGNVLKLVPFQTSLLILASNGVWAITGTDGGFAADDFAVRKVSSVNILSSKSLVEVDGAPVWWGDYGIYTVSEDQASGNPTVTSLTDSTIKSFYDDIPILSKKYVQGAYDPLNRKLMWLYNTAAPSADIDRFRYNRVLNLDLDLGAFYPWSIEDLATDTPQVSGITSVPPLSTSTSTFTVVDSSLDTVVTAALDTVVADIGVLTSTSSAIKLLTVVLDGATYEVTLSEFNNTVLKDWVAADATGVEYRSFLTTGYELFGDVVRFKQAPYVYTYLKDNDDFTNFSLYLQGRWDFSISGNSGKYTSQFQTYRNVGNSDTGVLVTRHKFRGKGRALQFNFESDAAKDFNILGWAIDVQGNAKV